MALKALVPDSSHALASSRRYEWQVITQLETFVEGIRTGDVGSDEAALRAGLHRLLAGVPSPWARALVFQYAIDSYIDEEQAFANTPQGINAIYKLLIDEWKGLVATLILDSASVTVEKVSLAPDPSRSYDFRGGLGRLLFEDRKAWETFSEADPHPEPAIQLIRYKGQVVGGTHPFVLVFPASRYDGLLTDLPYYHAGAFTDPLRYSLNQEQLEKVYQYVGRIKKQLDGFQEALRKYTGFTEQSHPIIGKMHVFLGRWLKELEQHARHRGLAIDADGTLGESHKFAPLFSLLFNISDKLYYSPRTSQYQTQKTDGSEIEINPAELLLDETTTRLAKFEITREDAEQLAVVVCQASYQEGGAERFAYFSLPFSLKGLQIMGQRMNQVLATGTAEVNTRERLVAEYQPEQRQIRVTLRLNINGKWHDFVKTYQQFESLANKTVQVWPDFQASNWTSYFLYSELPYNGQQTIRALPLVATTVSAVELPEFSVVNQELPDGTERLVEYQFSKLQGSNLLYEIYKSNKPFIGLKLVYNAGTQSDLDSGFVFIKRTAQPGAIRQLETTHNQLLKARVGIDFGSNNTCVSWSMNNRQAQLLQFRNRRRFFIGTEEPLTNVKSPAEPYEVFFFQRHEPVGQLKSMILLHDQRRLANPDTDSLREVAGGLPVFEPNLPIVDSVPNRLKLAFGLEQTDILHDLKWSHDDQYVAAKKALLKTIWLKVCAELFSEQRAEPERLVWAYPSAMSKGVRRDNRAVWEEVLNKIRPTVGNRALLAEPEDPDKANAALTESEAVCRFALGVDGLIPIQNTLTVGLDVGGSTTDMLIVGLIPGSSTPRLARQTSIRVAASELAAYAGKVPDVQKALKLFAEREKIHIYRIEEINANTAGYFLNNIFDRCSPEQLKVLYQMLYQGANVAHIDKKATMSMFVIAGYLSGLIAYYLGQQIGKLLEEPDYAQTTQVRIGLYGKGARIFDWLVASFGRPEAEKFYRDSLIAGLGEQSRLNERAISFQSTEPDTYTHPKHNKSEVTLGLSTTLANDLDLSRLPDLADVVGEEGFLWDGQPVSADQTLSPEFLAHFNGRFQVPVSGFPRFRKFLNHFSRLMIEYNLLSKADFDHGIERLPSEFANFILNDPEYKQAKHVQAKTNEFTFVYPMSVGLGMCFLHNTIIPSLRSQRM